MTEAEAAPDEADVVIIEWDDLKQSNSNSSLLEVMERAYGPDGTGILAIRNVPGFVQAKAACLPLAHALAHLPADYLETELTDATSLYNAGWSHGKEKLGNEPDYHKASFYYNPVTDLAGTPQDRVDFPLSYPANKWPSEDQIPGFRTAAQKLGCILKDAVVAVSYHIDALAQSKVTDYPPHFLYNLMKETDKVKARLLYYYPLGLTTTNGDEVDTSTTSSIDSWIGWHNDSGFLTALAGDLYVHHSHGTIVAECPDPSAGLYIVDRHNRTRHVTLPADCLAVQVGECTQIITAGAVSATPHCVRGLQHDATLARISLPCFVDAPPRFELTVPTSSSSREQVLSACHPSLKVPPLGQRWTDNGMTFGAFLEQTFRMYYDWNEETKE